MVYIIYMWNLKLQKTSIYNKKGADSQTEQTSGYQ